MNDSANPKIDVLTGRSTLILCFLLCHFSLANFRITEYKISTGARKKLQLLTTLLLSPYIWGFIEILSRAPQQLSE